MAPLIGFTTYRKLNDGGYYLPEGIFLQVKSNSIAHQEKNPRPLLK
jgi:hypothetical protein